MAYLSKMSSLALLLVLIASSLLVVGNAFAAVSKPSVPEGFSIAFSEHPFDVAPKTRIDPYTGENVTYEGGYHEQNKTIEFTVKNQPFVTYTDGEGHQVGLYYKISYKGHYEQYWDDYSQPLLASSSAYSILSVPSASILSGIPAGGKVDLRIQAGIGYVTSFEYFMDTYIYMLNGETSDWTSTQTITIPGSASTPTPTLPAQSTPTSTATALPTQNPTTTPTQPNAQTDVPFKLDWEGIALIVMAVAIAVMAVGMVALWRRIPAK